MTANPGVFTVSLDFELYWGVRDKRTLGQYGNNLRGVWEAIPELLHLFGRKGIHATWAAVGFLFFKDREALLRNLPERVPAYLDANLAPYGYLKASEELDPVFHFAPSLLEAIRHEPGQEIGTHTFSHYYCLEPGQTRDDFRADIKAAVQKAEAAGLNVESLVFPRNQWNPDYLNVLAEAGIKCYRGNERGWMYRADVKYFPQSLWRALRLMDAYIDVSGPNTFDLARCGRTLPYDFPSSRFLRPYSRPLAILDGLRARRIKKAMTFAAVHGQVFHLWWHPHNFGSNLNENLVFLAGILEHFEDLRARYGMKSMNMGELAQMVEDARR